MALIGEKDCYNKKMSEATSEGSVRPANTENLFKSVLTAFKRRFQKLTPVQENAEKVVPQEPLDSEQEERLRTSRKVFYHTTPTDRLDSIKKDGLFSPIDDSNVGTHLGYSVHFAYEHAIMRNHTQLSVTSVTEVEDKIPDNYVLTVWEDNPDFVKSQEPFEKRMGFRTMAKTVDRSQVPKQFFQAAQAGPDTFGFF